MSTRVFRLLLTAASLMILMACTGEEPVEIDLNETVPPTTEAPEDDDPNAAERQRLQELAEQQCLDDPSKEAGTVRIVDPATNEVVSELTVQCSEVRNP